MLRKIIKKGKRIIILGTGILAWTLLSVGAFRGAVTPFYRVKQQHAVVATEVDGDRWIDDRVGMHLRTKSLNPFNWILRAKEYSMRIEYISYPLPRVTPGTSTPQVLEDTIQAADKIPFPGDWVWTYKITDLRKFGIEMGSKALDMLTAELNGVAKAKIQTHNIEYIVTQMDSINKEVYGCDDVKDIESRYGIEIASFRLTKARYPTEMNEKAAKAKGIKIEAEAYRLASEDYAQGFKTRAEANQYSVQKLIEGSGITTEEGRKKALDTLALFRLYEVLKDTPGEETIVLHPYGNAPNMTLPSPNKQTQENKSKENDASKEQEPVTSRKIPHSQPKSQ